MLSSLCSTTKNLPYIICIDYYDDYEVTLDVEGFTESELIMLMETVKTLCYGLQRECEKRLGANTAKISMRTYGQSEDVESQYEPESRKALPSTLTVNFDIRIPLTVARIAVSLAMIRQFCLCVRSYRQNLLTLIGDMSSSVRPVCQVDQGKVEKENGQLRVFQLYLDAWLGGINAVSAKM